MVKSKKMSKSTVAIVLLSLLLVLSLILTATGAWFTYSANKGGANGGGDYTFRDNAMSVIFSDLSEDFGKIYRGDTVVEADDVMPGDTIKGGNITAIFSVEGTNTAYAVYRIDGGEWKNVKDDSAASTTNLVAISNGQTLKCADIADSTLTGDNYDNTYQGQDVDVSLFTIGSIEIRMIQTENISVEAAYNALNGTLFQANKA